LLIWVLKSKMELTVHVAARGVEEKCRVLMGKPGGWRLSGRPKYIWEYNTVIPRLTSDPANEFFG